MIPTACLNSSPLDMDIVVDLLVALTGGSSEDQTLVEQLVDLVVSGEVVHIAGTVKLVDRPQAAETVRPGLAVGISVCIADPLIPDIDKSVDHNPEQVSGSVGYVPD